MGRQRKNPSIAFRDCAFSFARILVLNDGTDLAARITNDTAITGRVWQVDGQQAQLFRADLLKQALQGLNFDQRDIAVQDQHVLCRYKRQCLSHGVAGAQLLVLQYKIQVFCGQTFAY